jgi:molecular chaperone DnaK (HSP70)
VSRAATPSRYVVGIDLGTTHSALAYADADAAVQGEARIESLAIPQLIAPGTVEARTLLPSFLLLPRPGELTEDSLRLPWGSRDDGAVGTIAARRAAEAPDRVISSAKSWLCHPGVDRTARILPWAPGDDGGEVEKRSPVEASTAYLAHLRSAWDAAMAADDPGARLEEQEVVLTVPASFDAAARELTLKAAAAAGLERVRLLEEPQAAVYAWVHGTAEGWRHQVAVGDLVLVCDVGGGTTDLSLVRVDEEEGELALSRVAVGDHILLGGDNMDLALAFHVRERLAAEGQRLDGWQFRGLVLACREAKEALLDANPPESVPIVILGRGRKLIGSTIRTEIRREDAVRLLLDGFFPQVAAAERADTQSAAGLSELGLPFASDAAVTRHLATFLASHAHAVPEARVGELISPNAILFNGGVMAASALRSRVCAVIAGWASDARVAPRVLAGGDLAHAVSRGAAYYALAKRGRGVRIRGGTARAYYVGVASSMPAVPGQPPLVKSLCVVPFGVEEGTEIQVPGTQLGLLVGQTATFRFFASSTRADDAAGSVLDEWETEDLEELAPLQVRLDGAQQGRVPVRLVANVTELGALEIWCTTGAPGERWMLELDLRGPERRAR